MEVKVILTGVYLDPMYRCLLTEKQKIKGKDTACGIAIGVINQDQKLHL